MTATTNFNQSTMTAVQYGVGSANTYSFYVDTDGTQWNLGATAALGTPEIGYEQSYYPACGNVSFYNSSTNAWIPIFSTGGGVVMEKTGTVGEYFIGGQYTFLDNSSSSGWGSIVKFQKNNMITVNSSLINIGQTNRNNFNLFYKGQSVTLVNLDNSRWLVGNIPYNGGNYPNVYLY